MRGLSKLACSRTFLTSKVVTSLHLMNEDGGSQENADSDAESSLVQKVFG